MGLRHPLKHLRGKAIKSLRSEGVHVDVLREDLNGKIFEVMGPFKCITSPMSQCIFFPLIYIILTLVH